MVVVGELFLLWGGLAKKIGHAFLEGLCCCLRVGEQTHGSGGMQERDTTTPRDWEEGFLEITLVWGPDDRRRRTWHRRLRSWEASGFAAIACKQPCFSAPPILTHAHVGQIVDESMFP